jgi:hypothetical protein
MLHGIQVKWAMKVLTRRLEGYSRDTDQNRSDVLLVYIPLQNANRLTNPSSLFFFSFFPPFVSP